MFRDSLTAIILAGALTLALAGPASADRVNLLTFLASIHNVCETAGLVGVNDHQTDFLQTVCIRSANEAFFPLRDFILAEQVAGNGDDGDERLTAATQVCFGLPEVGAIIRAVPVTSAATITGCIQHQYIAAATGAPR